MSGFQGLSGGAADRTATTVGTVPRRAPEAAGRLSDAGSSVTDAGHVLALTDAERDVIAGLIARLPVRDVAGLDDDDLLIEARLTARGLPARLARALLA